MCAGLFPQFWLKTRDTQTIHRVSVPLHSLPLFTGHYGATGALQLLRDPVYRRPFTAVTRVQIPSGTPTKSGSTGVPLDRAEESPYSYASFSFDTLSFQKEAGGDPSVAFFSSTRLVFAHVASWPESAI